LARNRGMMSNFFKVKEGFFFFAVISHFLRWGVFLYGLIGLQYLV
jgi:hypothetical protein